MPAARWPWPGPGTRATCRTSRCCCPGSWTWTCGRAGPATPRRTCGKGSRPRTVAAGGTGPGAAQCRERELVTLVARGRTNAQIAAQLYISARTVGSHLDRIRDKTGCRRRADLTRLALSQGLV